MAEILVEKQICASCGVEVRPGALFCYNCGGAISAVPDKIESKNGNGANGDFAKRKNTTQTQLKDKKIEVSAQNEMRETEINGERELPTKTKLESAAAMRRKPKTIQKKEVEIVWEEQENPSSIVLILTALLLAIFAAAVIILAMTLK
jgi:hypothetical protein